MASICSQIYSHCQTFYLLTKSSLRVWKQENIYVFSGITNRGLTQGNLKNEKIASLFKLLVKCNDWRYHLYAKQIIFMFLTIPSFFFLVEVSLPVLRRRAVFFWNNVSLKLLIPVNLVPFYANTLYEILYESPKISEKNESWSHNSVLSKNSQEIHTSLLDALLFMAFKRITKFTEPHSGIRKDNI